MGLPECPGCNLRCDRATAKSKLFSPKLNRHRWHPQEHYYGYNYRAPPVVYGTPYNYGYYPPPVVYRAEPGVNFSVHIP